MNLKKLILFLLAILQCLLSTAQIKESLQQTTIRFSRSNLTVKEALDEMNKLPDISIVYSGTEEFLSVNITVPRSAVTVQHALDAIKLQAPVEILYNHNHVIMKARRLAETYLLEGTVMDDETGEADTLLAFEPGSITLDLDAEHARLELALPLQASAGSFDGHGLS